MEIHLSTCTLKVNSLNILIQFRMQQAFMNVKIGAREKSETYKISRYRKETQSYRLFLHIFLCQILVLMTAQR